MFIEPFKSQCCHMQQNILSVVSMNPVFLLSKMKVFRDICSMETQYYTPCAISSYYSTTLTEVNM